MVIALEKITKIIARHFNVTPVALYESFAPARESDLPAIIAFRQERLSKSIAWQDDAYLRWRYDFSCSVSTELNRLMLFKINGEILGLIGVDFAALVCRGERIAAFNPLDLLVASHVDGLGLGVWMSSVLLRDHSLMFAMGASSSARTIVQKSFTPMPDLGCWKYLLKSSRYLNKKIHPLLLPIITRCVDLGLVVARKWLARGKKKDWQFAPVLNFSLHAGALEQLVGSYRDSLWIMRLRSAEFLQWRFLINPRRQYQALGLFKDGVLVGYAVYHIKDHSHLHVDDLFAASDNLTGKQALMVRLLEIASRAKVDLLSFTAHNELWQTCLIPLGFTFRDDGHLFGVAVHDPQLQAHFIDPKHWWVTSADTHSEGF